MRNIFYLMVCFFIAVPFGAAQDNQEEAFSYGKTASFKAAHEVFKVSCLPCHSARQPLAWHARLPIVSSLKKKEFREALEGINFDETVYVAGLTPSLETLDKIETVVQRDQMPPLDYVLTHWSAKLSKKEKWAILDWIRDERRQYLQTGGFNKRPKTVVVSGVEMFKPFVPEKKQGLVNGRSQEDPTDELTGDLSDDTVVTDDANPFKPRGF